jgi:hypothetical protein
MSNRRIEQNQLEPGPITSQLVNAPIRLSQHLLNTACPTIGTGGGHNFTVSQIQYRPPDRAPGFIRSPGFSREKVRSLPGKLRRSLIRTAPWRKSHSLRKD